MTELPKLKVGDRVAWMGGFNFGSEVRRVVGTVTKVGLGVSSGHRYDAERDCFMEIGPRHPAVAVEADGHVRQVHEQDNVVAIKDLEIL